MPRCLEHARGRTVLDDLAQVHDRDARAHRAHHREVVRDEHVGERERLLQAPEQLQHAGLHGDVEARGRLVQDHQARPQREDARQPHAALLAAGELVRVEVEVGVGQADRGQDRAHLALPLGAGQRGVDDQRLVQQRADLPARVERGARVLVDVLQILGDGAPRAAGQPADLAAGEADLARGRRVDAHHRLAQRGLPAAALAHQPEGLARAHLQGHAVDGAQPADAPAERAAHREVALEVDQLQQRLGERAHLSTSTGASTGWWQRTRCASTRSRGAGRSARHSAVA